MDVVVNVIDTAIDFTKNTINKAMDVWESFDEDKKKLCTYCAAELREESRWDCCWASSSAGLGCCACGSSL